MNISLIDNPDTQYNATTKPFYPAPPVTSAVMLLRIRHLFAAGEGGQSSALGKPVSIDLGNLFAPHWNITSAVEMTLSGSMTLQEREASRLHWKQQQTANQSVSPGASSEALGHLLRTPDDVGAVTIAPMEVRTWKIIVTEGAG